MLGEAHSAIYHVLSCPKIGTRREERKKETRVLELNWLDLQEIVPIRRKNCSLTCCHGNCVLQKGWSRQMVCPLSLC